MKKILIILILTILIPVSIFASGFFDLSLGVTAAYQKAGALEEISSGKFDVKGLRVEDFKFGIDTDFKVLFLDFNGKGFFTRNSENQHIMNGIVSTNLLLDFTIFRIKIGLGYQYLLNLETDELSYGSITTVKNFEDFKDANFDIYAGVDIVLGDLIINAYATLPTEASIANSAWEYLFDTVADNWKAAQIGVGIGFSLF